MDRWRGLKKWQKWLAAGGTTLVVLIIIGAIFGEDSPAPPPPGVTAVVSEKSSPERIIESGTTDLWLKMTREDRVDVASRYIATTGNPGVTPKLLAERTTYSFETGFSTSSETIRELLDEVVADDGNLLAIAEEPVTPPATQAAPAPAPKPAPKPKPVPAGPVMAAQIVDSINEHLGSDDTDYDRPRAARANCSNDGFCEASYNADTPVFDTEGELIDAQRPIFKDAFAVRKLRSLTITTRGQVTTVGGKDLVDGVMVITCDRAANRQINWDNIDAGGVKQLCLYQALVKL